MAEPNVFTIPSDLPFVDTLAAGIVAAAGPEPEALAHVTVLLPTRRACRSLSAAFLRLKGGKPVLLPRMRPLGDLDEDEATFVDAANAEAPDALAIPPAIPPLHRQLLLTRLVAALKGEETSPEQAAQLARELARLLDQVQTERLDLRDAATLVEGALADHWQVTLRFFTILTEHWPQILAERGWIDPAERRNRLLEAQACSWRQRPPAIPVYAAGSTGSMPATADLLKVVAGLPRGAVILPGLDQNCDDDTWAAIVKDPGHPQFGMAQLLDRIGIDRRKVQVWPPGSTTPAPSARSALVARALRPASRMVAPRPDEPQPRGGLDGVSWIECPSAEEEARVVALVMREALETPGRTAALVTPSRTLARRVAAELQRWQLDVDDSAGEPLACTAPVVFLRLIAVMAARDFAPVSTLAVLKHPLAALGLAPAECRSRARRLELAGLRGPRPAPGIDGLRAIAGTDPSLKDLTAALAAAAQPLQMAFRRRLIPFHDLLQIHVETAEALATTDDQSGPERLWRGDAGDGASQFVASLREAADALPPVPPRDYPPLLDVLMADTVVRPRYGRHPRLAVWGPLEARLQRADVMILGGLNEGNWPPQVDPSPWMSRPMMEAFGLPLPERKIGLAAHDFAQAVAATRVVLTRAIKEDGTPTVPSRWLSRLRLFADRMPWKNDNEDVAARWLGWARALDVPRAEDCVTIGPPAPRPPTATRPRLLSVTQVETWMRDPYAIYARHILKLKRLDPLDADPDLADYGSAIHAALDTFVKACPGTLPDDAFDRLLAAGRQAFKEHRIGPGAWTFWWSRFERIARWVMAEEQQRRRGISHLVSEAEGAVTFDGPGGPFVLTAKADRIERRCDGQLIIVDYKTGRVPERREVLAGVSPQLPLEALIAARGGFKVLGDTPAAVEELQYWRLSGALPAGEVSRFRNEDGRLATAAAAGLQHLVEAFDQEQTPYHACPRPAAALRHNDYAHLARIKEWSTGRGEEG